MNRFELIYCVVDIGVASKTLKIAKKYGIKGAVISIGRGAVNNRILDFLGITEVRKEIVTMVVEKELASAAIKGISEEMEFSKEHNGIAFSLSITEFIGKNNSGSNDLNYDNNNEVKNSVYKIIYVIVDKGKGEDVIDAANKAGARGGTILNARGAGIHEVQKLFSMEIEPEKEEVFIITETSLKDGIIESIKNDLKIDEPGNGILFVMDVNEAYGLN